MKVLVTGAKGQLGYDVCRVLESMGINHIGVDIKDFDLTNKKSTYDYVTAAKPTCIVHCAAYTAVDMAETQKDLCTNINVNGTENIALCAKDLNAKFMYISTDYVFDGFSKVDEWEVDDIKNPQNHYGLTKYEGEKAAQSLIEKLFILRICWVFGKNGNNFVKTMLKLAKQNNEINVVDDQIGAPTYTYDAAKLICSMITTEKYGVYHASNEGFCSWYDFACEILANEQIKINPIKTKDYKTAAKRPQNSKLSKKSLDEGGFSRLPHYKDALKRYIANE